MPRHVIPLRVTVQRGVIPSVGNEMPMEWPFAKAEKRRPGKAHGAVVTETFRGTRQRSSMAQRRATGSGSTSHSTLCSGFGRAGDAARY